MQVLMSNDRAVDRAIVALNSNGTPRIPNPCVPYRVIDDTHPYTPADGGWVVNTLGETIVPPRGGSFYIPESHPAFTVVTTGSPWAYGLRACP